MSWSGTHIASTAFHLDSDCWRLEDLEEGGDVGNCWACWACEGRISSTLLTHGSFSFYLGVPQVMWPFFQEQLLSTSGFSIDYLDAHSEIS